jgi:hypothetical protein
MGLFLTTPQPAQEGDGLIGAGSSLREWYLTRPELLGIFAPYPHAERHPAAGGPVEIGDLLGHDGGWVERKEED